MSEPLATRPTVVAPGWRDHFTNAELESLRQVRDWRGWAMIATNVGIAAGAFALVAWWPNVLTVVVALLLLGGRQLGCAVVMHEAAHRTLFRDRAFNDWAGNWLGAYPAWSGEVEPYRRYHLLHHAHTGTPKDPDLGLAAPFPVTRKSMARKLWRDLSGQTGWKQARLLLTRDLGIAKRSNQRNMGLKEGQRADVGWHKVAPVVLTNAVIFAYCLAIGSPAVYLLWPLAWLTTYRVVLRIRAIAEHAMPSDIADPLGNTRTTRAGWWERLFLAPNRVNYHLEHHLVMTVPAANLPRMHRMLEARGLLDGALVAESYAQVLRQASARAA